MNRFFRAMIAVAAVLAAVVAIVLASARIAEMTPGNFLLAGLSRVVAGSGFDATRDLAYGEHPRHRLDLYRPTTDLAPKAPIVVFVYGGAWRSGAKSSYGFVASAFAKHGLITAIPDYRLYPDVLFPAFVDDIEIAVEWIASETAAAGLPIYLAGHSAGAHIAAMLAFDTTRLTPAVRARIAGFVGLAGPYAFDPTTWPSTRDIFASAKDPDAARPVAQAGSGSPPALLLHGGADTIVKPWNTNELADRLTALGDPAERRIYDGIGHIGLVLTLAGPLRWRAPALDDIAGFVAARTD